jgi:hypothetical protein
MFTEKAKPFSSLAYDAPCMKIIKLNLFGRACGNRLRYGVSARVRDGD